MYFAFRGKNFLRYSVAIAIVALCLWSPGAFALVCGDSAPDLGETCDDGNLINGDGCSATCEVEAGFDCTTAIAGQATENILGDGSFELDDGSWSISGWTAGRCDSLCAGGSSWASDGEFWIWVGGSGDASSSGSASQTFLIPSSASTLTFDVMSSANACGDSNLAVDIDGNVLWTFEDQGYGECKTVGPYSYEQVSLDINAFNQDDLHTVTLTGDYVPAGSGQNANWFFDNFRVDVPMVPPVPPTPSMCAAIVCGDGILGSFESCDDGNTASGDGCSSGCLIEQPNFTCEAPLPAAASGDNLFDGGLEKGLPNPLWKETGTVFAPICSQALCGAALAKTGVFFGWFGGASTPHEQTLTQDVRILPTATDLGFELLVGVCDSASDSLTVEIDGTEIFRYDCLIVTTGYQPQTVPLGAFADGLVHTLQFIGHTEAVNGDNSNFFVDDISIKDNLPFAGAPGICTPLAETCTVPEQFQSGIPVTWTVLNLGPDAADGWGVTNDGICATTGNYQPVFNVNATGGGGESACADSDATGQADGGAGSALEMDSYLCSPAWDLTQVSDPALTFLANYQTPDNTFNDNDTPADTGDDFDDDYLRVLVGAQTPNALTLPAYIDIGNIPDHLDTSLAISAATKQDVSLALLFGESQLHVCFNYRGTFDWFAQIDNVALRGSACVPPPDTDSDGIPDSLDNCVLLSNPNQVDSDGDGIGNLCDPDLDNDCVVTVCPGGFGDPSCELTSTDMALLKGVFSTADPDGDFNVDGIVDAADLAILESFENLPPGPSGQPNACDPPPPDADNDGIADGDDNCPMVWNPLQVNYDRDSEGDACDDDDDNDGRLDATDAKPKLAAPNNCTGSNAKIEPLTVGNGEVMECRAQTSIMNKGSFVVASGGEALFVSQVINLESGFTVQSGATFSAVTTTDIAN